MCVCLSVSVSLNCARGRSLLSSIVLFYVEGTPGRNGITGASGATGLKGENGATGATGLPGPIGASGLTALNSRLLSLPLPYVGRGDIFILFVC